MSDNSTQERNHNRLHCYDDLDGSRAHAWTILERGAVDAKSSFHIATLATVSKDGTPRARSVVLRAATPPSAGWASTPTAVQPFRMPAVPSRRDALLCAQGQVSCA